MPQRGDNPNEVLFDTGSPWAYRNVDNYYDADSNIHRPVDEVLSALEEEFECPLVHLVFRRTTEVVIHTHIYTTKPQPVQRMPSHDDLLKHYTEIARIEEYLEIDPQPRKAIK